jgi:NitT/TauT family transport system permease protein
MPSKVIIDGCKLFSVSSFYYNTYYTLSNWTIAFICGMSLGLFLGFLSGINKKIEQLILPISAFLRSVPPIALFPIFLIILGPGKVPIVVAGIIGVVIYIFPIVNEAAEATKNKFQDLSLLLNLTKKEFIELFIIPGTLISSIISSRIAASYLFAICIAGEIIIGGSKGIGAAINSYSERYLLEEAYFYILITGSLGLILDLAFAKFQRQYSFKR